MIPQRFLEYVTGGAGFDANDACAIAQIFHGITVIGTDFRIVDQPGQEIHARCAGMICDSTCQFHHVLGLSAGVGIPAKLQVITADQAMNADQADIQPFRGIF